MGTKINFKVLDGHRDKLESQISHALFAIFEEKQLGIKLDEIYNRLASKGKLTPVTDNVLNVDAV